MIFLTHSQEETKELAKKIATDLNGGDIVLLEGELGAGKTTFTKGLAEGLGVTNEITSPTFTLMNVYNLQPCLAGRQATNYNLQTLIHIDTYRLKNEQELIEIGIEDYLGDSSTVCVIEWPEKISKLLLNKKTIRINIEHDGKDGRLISLTSPN